MESSIVSMVPRDGLEGKSNIGLWGFSPCSVLSSEVNRGSSLIEVLWDWEELSESLLDKVNELSVILDSTGNNQALAWGDVVHNELLEKSSIDVVDVVLKSVSWHAQGVVPVSCSEKKLRVLGEGIVFVEVVM